MFPKIRLGNSIFRAQGDSLQTPASYPLLGMGQTVLLFFTRRLRLVNGKILYSLALETSILSFTENNPTQSVYLTARPLLINTSEKLGS